MVGRGYLYSNVRPVLTQTCGHNTSFHPVRNTLFPFALPLGEKADEPGVWIVLVA